MGDSKPDVQMLCHQIVAKVSEYSPGGVLGSLDALIEPLEKTCNKQVGREAWGGGRVEKKGKDQVELWYTLELTCASRYRSW